MKRILISLTLVSCILLAGCGESVVVTDSNKMSNVNISNVNSNTIAVKDLSSILI